MCLKTDQGPFWLGYWLLQQLRSSTGAGVDGAASAALACALSDQIRITLKGMAFNSCVGNQIHLRIDVSIRAHACTLAARAAWAAYVAQLSQAVRVGTLDSEVIATSSSDGIRKLHMVFNELVYTWGMLALGRWPQAGLLVELADGEKDSHAVVAEAALGAAEGADGSAVGGGGSAGAPAAAAAAVAAPIAAGLVGSCASSPVAVVSMAGAALARTLRKLDAPARRKFQIEREEYRSSRMVERRGEGGDKQHSPSRLV